MLKKTTVFLSILVVLSILLAGVVVAAGGPVQTAGDGYFSGGTKNIKAADLFDNLNDGDTSNDPFIIDVRKPEDYALGHVSGAVNIGVTKLFSADTLATIPTDKEVVVYCYTGQTSSQAVSALNMMGYTAKSMLFGFPAWAMVDGLVGPAPFNAATDQHDYMVSTDAAAAMGSYDAATELGDTVAAAAEAYFSNGTKNIKASALFDNLNDGDTSNDPIIIDVRKKEDYDKAHIPGALYVSSKEAATPEALSMFDPGKQIVVYCYTGQTGSQVTALLNMLGYDATNLKFGFAAWSTQGGYSFNAANSPNYRFEGTGTVAEAAPAAEATTTEAAAPAPAPAELPATGGAFSLNLLYVLVGAGALGSGAYLRRK